MSGIVGYRDLRDPRAEKIIHNLHRFSKSPDIEPAATYHHWFARRFAEKYYKNSFFLGSGVSKCVFALTKDLVVKTTNTKYSDETKLEVDIFLQMPGLCAKPIVQYRYRDIGLLFCERADMRFKESTQADDISAFVYQGIIRDMHPGNIGIINKKWVIIDAGCGLAYDRKPAELQRKIKKITDEDITANVNPNESELSHKPKVSYARAFAYTEDRNLYPFSSSAKRRN